MTQEHFEHIAEDYDHVFKAHISDHYLQKRIKLIRELRPGHRILDFGCGTGILAARLREFDFDVAGTDTSAAMLEKALARGVEGRLLAGDTIPYDANTFDLVYSVAVFHHLETKPVVKKALAEMVRVAKPGGMILIWDHNPRNFYWKILMPRLPQDHGDERLVPLEEITDTLKELHVSRVRYWRKGWVPEFVPRWLMPLVRGVELLLENTPLLRSLSAHNIIVGTKE